MQPAKQEIVELSTDSVSVTVWQKNRNGVTVTQTGSRGKGELSSNKQCLTWGEGRRGWGWGEREVRGGGDLCRHMADLRHCTAEAKTTV